MNVPRSPGEVGVSSVRLREAQSGRLSHDEPASSEGHLVGHSNNISNSAAEDKIDAVNRAGSRIKELVEQIEALPHSPARVLFQECMESVLAFYGHGLERILQLAANAGPDGQKLYRDLIQDNVVRGLLLIHDLHPVDIATRLRDALDRVRPYLESHGGNVELISLVDDVARLRLEGTCKSCASSAVTMELAIRHAIEEACPDLIRFEVEGVSMQNTGTAVVSNPQRATPDWIVIDDAQQLGNDEGISVRVADVRLIVCRVNGNLYAYRNNCPTCNMPLTAGIVDGGLLKCGLGHRYDVRHAGLSMENPKVHLDPFPLLVRDDTVKVAVVRK